MSLFSRETQRLRVRYNQLQSEVSGLRSQERRLSARLRRLAWVRAELEASRAETDDDTD